MTPETDCLFCRISSGDVPSRNVYSDDRIFAFEDINPQAPRHILICPREHLATLNDVAPRHEALMGHVVRVAADLAKKAGDADAGYRLVANCQAGAGQSVFHIHFHLLGGRSFHWPPG